MKKLLIALIIAACGSNSFAYYQAQQGRWMSRDPIAEKGGMNIYGMVGNNPISQYDLLGMSFWDYGQFLRWLGNTPDEAEHVNWGIIDPDGTGKHLLRQGWIVSNKDWFRATCNNANTGHSEYGPRLSRFERNSILNRKHAWISRWNGSVSLAEGGVGLDKSSSTCKCTFEFGLDFKARD